MKNFSSSQKEEEDDKIYLNIDHLKKGQYVLKILLNNKVIKSVRIIK